MHTIFLISIIHTICHRAIFLPFLEYVESCGTAAAANCLSRPNTHVCLGNPRWHLLQWCVCWHHNMQALWHWLGLLNGQWLSKYKGNSSIQHLPLLFQQHYLWTHLNRRFSLSKRVYSLQNNLQSFNQTLIPQDGASTQTWAGIFVLRFTIWSFWLYQNNKEFWNKVSATT